MPEHQSLELKTENISKRFGSTVANDSISLSFSQGKIYAIIGENGAGKTTFLNVLFGIHRPDSGRIFLNGKEQQFGSPRDSIKAGIYLVQQNFSLIEKFSIAENLNLLEEMSLRPINRSFNNIMSLTKKMKWDLDPKSIVDRLPVSFRQEVEIMKGLQSGANILMLDEPTSVLGPVETETLGTTIRSLASEGRIVLLTSHKLDQVMRYCDCFVVFRRGGVVASGNIAEIRKIQELVRHMFGDDLVPKVSESRKDTDLTNAAVVLEVAKLAVKGNKGRKVIDEASLKIRRGEIMGLAGVAGNGQKELAETVVGLSRATSGSISLKGTNVTGLPTREIRRKGVGYIPEEGGNIGLVPDFTVAENLSLTTFDLGKSSSFVLDRKGMTDKADKLIEEYGISPPSKYLLARHFSGGNMQKMIVARELSRSLELLVCCNPTKGLDMRTTHLVHEKLLEKKTSGTAILLISEDLEEIMALSDMIAVIFEGKIVGVVEKKRASIQDLGHLMSGQKNTKEESRNG